ncbi:hypothetical protein HO133_006072 [Letharia lupina]|uniref:Apple domain-containing protein n=1 Tax=Letharia lupina TaxID=560253 RepID=A0A8H6C781_9LECA|nr:uncharacterized protein HO133_006072 [Letharia lupina]KAF6218114.1 hypothetical protein HO133_006072 [Letharia lupina]
MRASLSIVGALGFAAKAVLASPNNGIEARNLTPQQCSEVVLVIDVLKLHSATPFCSSFLGIQPTTKTTVSVVKTTSTSTTTTTVTSGTASTSVIFEPGNPPATTAPARVRRGPVEVNADAVPEIIQRNAKPPIPTWLTSVASSAISSACDCLSIPTPTSTVTKVSSSTVVTVTTATITTTPAVVSKTYYPCATPLPTLTPQLPYGLSNGVGESNTEGNNLYGIDTPQGASAEACCNTCYFEIPYCIQAYWYFYEGCVVDQATTVTGSGDGISTVCPQGTVEGLTYSNDTNPAFRSTGDFAGPCGQTYDDLPY